MKPAIPPARQPNSHVTKRSFFHRFYFIEPQRDADIDALAMKLISLEQVEEVFLTEGKYGFVVRARFSEGDEPADLASYISRNISSRFGHAMSHYAYRK